MIIKLPNADFSANNIGQIDLRTEVSASTQNFLDIYGKTWTLDQKFAIEDFLTGFNSATWKTKVDTLVIPTLAPATVISRNDQNLKGFYDIITESYLTASYGGAYTTRRFVANGFTDDGGTGAATDLFGITMPEPTSYDSIHFGTYWAKSNDDEVTDLICTDGGAIFENEDFFKANTSGTNLQTNYDTTGNVHHGRGLKITSYDNTGGSPVIAGLSNNLNFSSSEGSGTVNNYNPSMNLLSRYSDQSEITLGLITRGSALTEAEIVEYNTLINELMDALWTV